MGTLINSYFSSNLKKMGSLLKILILFIVLVQCLPATGQSMSGITIGDNAKSLKKLGVQEVTKNESGPFTIVKFRLADGNELSVTYERQTQRIVFLETDWLGNRSGTFSDFRGFEYGSTTLQQIRETLGSNGIAYQSNGGIIQTEGGVALLNAYEVVNRPNIVAVFISRIDDSHFEDIRNNPNLLSSYAILESIILSERSYLDRIWGAVKIYAPDYKDINWP